jgi:tetratricopeptide (TPR) repeat protein
MSVKVVNFRSLLVVSAGLLVVLTVGFSVWGTFSHKINATAVKPAVPSMQTSSQQNLTSLTAEQWLDLSRSHFQERRYVESVGAAQTAVYLKSDYAEAYNNIGAAYAALKIWDAAIQADQQALRLKPDFQLARNNLIWALEQKRLGIR